MSIETKLTQIMNNVPLVYDAGYDEGYEDGMLQGGDTTEAYNQGVNAGKQEEYDAFWDSYQLGVYEDFRTNCLGLFAGGGWNATTFKPKHKLYPINALQMFFHFNENEQSELLDLTAVTSKNGEKIIIDFSRATNVNNAFSDAGVSHIGEVDLRAVGGTSTYSWSGMFTRCKAHTIDKIIFAETNPPFENMFQNYSALVHCIFEGTIAKNGLNLSSCTKLDKESIKSVVNCLSNTTTGLTVTLSLTAVKREFETSAGANDGNTSAKWLSLTAPKTDTNQQYYWIISLI